MQSQQQQQNMQRYPSMTSVHSMVSVGYLPPGHGYVFKKQKPDKPYGPSFVTIMNRTWRGPGSKYLTYALVAFCFSLLFYISASLYFGHRNVSRMIVLRTEVFGAVMIIIGICLTALTFHYIWKARIMSNRWRAGVRFRSEGLYVAAAYNHAYLPEDETELLTGTYGPKALKEVPKQRPRQPKQQRSRLGSFTDRPDASAQPPAEGKLYQKKGRAARSTEGLADDTQDSIDPYATFQQPQQQPYGRQTGSREYLGPQHPTHLPAPPYAGQAEPDYAKPYRQGKTIRIEGVSRDDMSESGI